MKVLSDTELLSLFEQQKISNVDWTHALHIRVASIYLKNFAFDAALNKLKVGIKKLNAVNAVPESQFRGFHETLTVGWLKLVRIKLSSSKSDASLDLLEEFPELLNSRLLNEYYSHDYLMSLRAKTNFVEPDLKPLV